MNVFTTSSSVRRVRVADRRRDAARPSTPRGAARRSRRRPASKLTSNAPQSGRFVACVGEELRRLAVASVFVVALVRQLPADAASCSPRVDQLPRLEAAAKLETSRPAVDEASRRFDGAAPASAGVAGHRRAGAGGSVGGRRRRTSAPRFAGRRRRRSAGDPRAATSWRRRPLPRQNPLAGLRLRPCFGGTIMFHSEQHAQRERRPRAAVVFLGLASTAPARMRARRRRAGTGSIAAVKQRVAAQDAPRSRARCRRRSRAACTALDRVLGARRQDSGSSASASAATTPRRYTCTGKSTSHTEAHEWTESDES